MRSKTEAPSSKDALQRQLVSTPTAFEDNAHLIGRTVWELLKEHDLKRMA